MKRVKLLFTAILLGALFCGSQAQAIDLYGFGSYWDRDDVDGTWGGGLGLSLPLFTEHLRLDGRVYYFEDSDLGLDNGSLSITPFDLGVQVHILPGGVVDPYVLGGVSYLYVDSDRIDFDSKVSGYLGAGLDVDLGFPLLKLFGEALYREAEVERVFGDDINMSGFTGNVGLKLHF